VTLPKAAQRFSIAVFPFLKTTGRVRVGGLEFRSTTDLDGLTPAESLAVTETARMLYLRDEDRIEAASIAIAPYCNLDRREVDASNLEAIQAVIAYLYISPHETSGDPFLRTEHASLVLLTPGNVTEFLVGTHGISDDGTQRLPRAGDSRHELRGYSGLYNFRHHFWVAPGSRIYGPAPHMILNLSQDLADDIERASAHAHHRALLRRIQRETTAAFTRVLTALEWFNSANAAGADDSTAIVHLAIAFETLLALPQSEKPDRIVDSISLLLGRVPRLDAWASQFYNARSVIVHEGAPRTLHFVLNDSRRNTDATSYQSLLAYGRQIFRLCVATLVTGAELAEASGLAERFVPNHERFAQLCKLLADSTVAGRERLAKAEPLVEGIEHFRFVADEGLRLEAMLGATRLAATCLLESVSVEDDGLREALEAVRVATKPDPFDEMGAVQRLHETLQKRSGHQSGSELEIVARLVEAVWGYVFMHYFWLQRQKQSATADKPTETTA
jgi:hypothetical protein